MPESAEVKITVDYLHSKMENKVLTKWNFVDGKYKKKNPSGFKIFEKSLPLVVEQVGCKGKLIYFILYNEFCSFFILHSLRMTGRWQEEKDKYCKWYIEIENRENEEGKEREGGKKEKIWFRNPRCFATLQFHIEERVFEGILATLGPDILTEEFSLDVWRKLLKKHKNKNITSFLMNQRIISGVGNYLKAECLFYAGISPLRKVNSLTIAENEKLFEALRIIPRLAYNYGGLSIRDYANHKGEKGQYESHLKVYCQKKAEKIKTPDGRTTYWDPEVQK